MQVGHQRQFMYPAASVTIIVIVIWVLCHGWCRC